jgi:hypothetical protein
MSSERRRSLAKPNLFGVAGVLYWIMPDRKIIDESHKISDRRGNGQLRREVWVDEEGRVTRYNLAYINHGLHQGDNGRVVGYDNQHGYHHRHYFGGVESIDFVSFEDVEGRFEQDWIALRDRG